MSRNSLFPSYSNLLLLHLLPTTCLARAVVSYRDIILAAALVSGELMLPDHCSVSPVPLELDFHPLVSCRWICERGVSL